MENEVSTLSELIRKFGTTVPKDRKVCMGAEHKDGRMPEDILKQVKAEMSIFLDALNGVDETDSDAINRIANQFGVTAEFVKRAIQATREAVE